MVASLQAGIVELLDGRQAAFSYRCNACNRCCRDKLIPVNPYEVARIARHLGLSTTETLARFTTDGSALAFPDGVCVFLGEQGCGVHADRPLVCRLYPLGRVVQPDDSETIVRLRPHPDSAGTYATDGTVEQYFELQGAAPLMDAARRYHRLLARVLTLLAAQGERAEDEAEEVEEGDGGGPDLLDLDAAVQQYCREHQLAVPDDPWLGMELHLAAVDEWLDALSGRTGAWTG